MITYISIFFGCVVVIQFGFMLSLYKEMKYYRDKYESDNYFDDIGDCE
jgi:hypothetical protein